MEAQDPHILAEMEKEQNEKMIKEQMNQAKIQLEREH